ncbi:hypothetical protein N0V88_002675 [Collariella sp. IMI 366227]|nr:hypothetical protein N0V88_002675 [Collariella sp. IMI 366227]
MYIMVLLGGFGFHGSDIVARFGMDTMVIFFKGILAFPIIWNLTICFSKLSVLLMYITVIPVTDMIIACRSVGLFIILWNFGGVLGALLMCRPFVRNWDQSVDGTCGDNRLYYMWLGAINVVVEGVMLLLPMPFLFRLQIERFKKLIVIALFSIGWMTCAVTIYRQAKLPHLYFEDMTYIGILATMFTGIEPAVALSLACVPFLRPLIRGNLDASRSDNQYASGALSNGTSWGGSRALKELNDHSSEIQLRPVEIEALKYEAEVGPGQKQTPENEGAILVSKRWDVVSGARPGS